MEKILIILGAVFVIVLAALFFTSLARAFKRTKSGKLGKLYFKQWPDGNRTFHLALDVDLQDLKSGEVYTITVKEEKPTDAELEIVREVSEE